MSGMPEADVRLGAVVFARLMGFPWWPAIVQRSPENGQWQKGGKFWVLFFEDTNGAWLKSSELRAFDSYNRAHCLEQNGAYQKFKRYKDRVNKAIKLAEKYLANPKGKRGSKRLPPRPEHYEVVSISDDQSDGSEDAAGNRGRKGHFSRKGSRKRKYRASSLDEEDSEDEDDDPLEDEVVDEEVGRDEEGRSRRKRVRSSRYDEFISSRGDRNSDRRRSLRYPSPDGLRSMGEKANSAAMNDPSRGPQTHSKHGERDGKSGSGKRRRVPHSNGREPVENGAERYRYKSKRKGEVRGEQVNEESTADTDSREGMGSVVVRPPTSRRLANEPIRRAHPATGKRTLAEVTREMYISELTSLANPKDRKDAGKPHKLRLQRRTVRSRTGSSEYDDTSQSDQGTDSEKEPERERRVTNGSLEAAAEDLVEYAVRDGRCERNDGSGSRAEVLGMHCAALGGNDMVCAILNRLSRLEQDVAILQSKAKQEDFATLGEDVTAAGLKSAVEALASATTAFAKAREFDSGAISRSLELLWSEGRFPLPGPDGELLRTMVTSLVLAPCRRRREKLSREKQKRNQERKAETERLIRIPIRQKADIRQRTRSSGERERKDEPRLPHTPCSRVGNGPSIGNPSDASLSDQDDKTRPQTERLNQKDNAVINGEKGGREKGVSTVPFGVGKTTTEQTLDEGGPPDEQTSKNAVYEPNEDLCTRVEVVEEEVLGEEGTGEGFAGDESTPNN